MDALTYQGKQMVVEPINRSLVKIAYDLKAGMPVVAELEPGDATYYCLLLVPAWAPCVVDYLGRYGIQRTLTDEPNFLLAVKLDADGGRAAWIPCDNRLGVWHTAHLSENTWSQEFLVWWLLHLIDRLNAE